MTSKMPRNAHYTFFTGSTDLENHVKSEKHRKAVRAASTSKSIDNFVTKKFTPLDNKICAAEGALAFHVVKHHLSFLSQDCTASLLREIFPDSQIAIKISCARMKAEAIISNVISPHVENIVFQDLQKASFVSISTDGSNHGHEKLFPIVAQYFDHAKNGIQVKMLDLQETKDEKAATIVTCLETVLAKHGIKEKLTAFAADNTNSNFGGLNRGGTNNIHALLKKNISSNVLGIGCSAHVLHNSVQHGLGRFDLFDVDTLAFKTYQYFSIYTVRTENLKEFCDFVEVSFRELLYHSKTRWLSLMPVVHRLLQMYPALKSYFASQEKPPIFLQKFYDHDLGECFLLFVHSLMSIFHDNVKKLEKKNNSIIEILNIVDVVSQALRDRINSKFLPLTIKTTLSRLRAEGKDKECDHFVEQVMRVYTETEEYLRKWTACLSEFRIFRWLDFQYHVPFTHDCIEKSVEYLQGKGVVFDETKLFDQTMNLVRFIKQKQEENDLFFKECCNDKICQFFLAKNNNIDAYSEILKIAEFFFSIPGHNASCERIFSLVKSQWTDERNRLSVKTVRDLVRIKFNFNELNCKQFYEYLLRPENLKLLHKISNSDKYCPVA